MWSSERGNATEPRFGGPEASPGTTGSYPCTVYTARCAHCPELLLYGVHEVRSADEGPSGSIRVVAVGDSVVSCNGVRIISFCCPSLVSCSPLPQFQHRQGKLRAMTLHLMGKHDLFSVIGPGFLHKAGTSPSGEATLTHLDSRRVNALDGA